MEKLSGDEMRGLLEVIGKLIKQAETKYMVPLLPDCHAEIKFTRPPDQQAIHRLAVILIGMKESFPEQGAVRSLEQIVTDALAARGKQE
jgi:hypothetical protein